MNLSPGVRRIFEFHTCEAQLRGKTVSILFVKVTLALFAWLVWGFLSGVLVFKGRVVQFFSVCEFAWLCLLLKISEATG